MIGTLHQPWISADPHIDLDGLRALWLPMIRGIALADSSPSAYGRLYDQTGAPDGYIAQRRIMELSVDDPVRVAFESLSAAGLSPTRTIHARRLFLNLAYNSYSGGVGISLRAENGNYQLKNHAEHTRETPNAKLFPELLAYLQTLPFSEIGRVHLFVNYPNCETPIHSDGGPYSHKHEFLWLSVDSAKQFFIFDSTTNTKSYINGHSAFFDEHCWHGTEPSKNVVYSIRVDGFFTQEFREKLGIAHLKDYCNDHY